MTSKYQSIAIIKAYNYHNARLMINEQVKSYNKLIISYVIKLQCSGFNKVLDLKVCFSFHRIVDILIGMNKSDFFVHLSCFQIDRFEKKADHSCCGHIRLIHESDLIIYLCHFKIDSFSRTDN